MIHFRRYVRPAFRDDGASFRTRRERDIAERYGPVIDLRRPGLVGWLKSLNLGQFVLLCILVSVGILVGTPILGLLALIAWDQIRPTLIAAGWW